MTLRPFATFVLIPVLAFSLAACGGDDFVGHENPELIDEGTPTPDVIASPSPSPSDGLLTTEQLLALMPEKAGQNDVEGAIVTAQFFLPLYSLLFVQGQTGVESRRIWASLMIAGCEFCESSKVSSDAWILEGKSRIGGTLTIVEGTLKAFLREDGTVSVGYSVVAEPSSTVLANGEVELDNAGEGSDGDFAFIMEYRDGLWLVQGIGYE